MGRRRQAIALALVYAVTATTITAAATKKKKRKKQRAKKPVPAKVVDKPVRDPTEDYITRPDDADASPAFKYGALDRAACEAELKKRKVRFVRETARGVKAPVRLLGPVNGVTYRTNLPDKKRATTHWEIGDCRLILAMHDFAAILTKHDIVEVRHYSMYRPGPDDHPIDQPTKRHPAGLALDAGRFIGRDGTVYDVDDHWNGKIGAKTCGPDARPDPVTPQATKLRAILCEAVDARIFNVMLTPNYDPPHKNHFHLEVTAGATWFLVH